MLDSTNQRFLLVFRLLMAWTFIYAASHQAFDPTFSIVGFLKTTKTFHALFVPFTQPAVAPVFSVLVAWGHLAIGVSLLVGCLVRVSGIVGTALLLTYWLAHMDFPYIENHNNFLVDYHIVYSVVLVFLVVNNAGRVFGIDGWLAQQSFMRSHPALRAMVA